MGESQGNEKFADLRESLRRVDSVLNFARRLLRDAGEIPPGLVEDFHEARRDTEKAFVFVFDKVDDRLQKLLREFLQATKGITARQIAANADKLSKRARSALNQLVIFGGGDPTLTDELGAVRFSDNDPKPEFDPPPAKAPAKSPVPAAPRVSRPLMAMVLIGLVAAVALVVAFVVAPWSSAPPYNYDANRVAANDASNRPANDPASNQPDVDDTTPFDAANAGYISPLRAAPLTTSVSPLEADPKNLPPGELAWLMLGYEELIHLLEPDRLAAPPDRTRDNLRKFGEAAAAAEASWIEQRKPLLDAFVAHVAREQQLVMYPADTARTKVLVSDVLYSAGGGQLSLVVTLQVLAQSCNAPIRLIAPLGPDRPLLAVDTREGVTTYNGLTFGLREGRQPVLLLSELLVELTRMLRPTLDTPEARLLCSAVTHRHSTLFTIDHARQALADFDVAWLPPPPEDADERALLIHKVALLMQPVVCETLLKPVAQGDATEALTVYRLAAAVNDEDRANRALLALGERAQRGATLDGKPLALAVGDLLASQDNLEEADKWFFRAMDDHPEDPRPVMRLIGRRQGVVQFDLCREGYARGERSVGFLRTFARSAAEQQHDLLALQLLDELIAGGDFDALDLQNAALMCISLGRTDWALKRLADNGDITAGEPALQRLDLICELSVNGLSSRAQELAKLWRAGGKEDPFVESLLRRYGG